MLRIRVYNYIYLKNFRFRNREKQIGIIHHLEELDVVSLLTTVVNSVMKSRRKVLF